MSVSSDRGQEDAGVDLQEAKMSFPKLVRRQTANIPPEEKTGGDLSIPSQKQVMFYLWQPTPFHYPLSSFSSVATHSKIQSNIHVQFHPFQNPCSFPPTCGNPKGEQLAIDSLWKPTGKHLASASNHLWEGAITCEWELSLWE